LLPLFKHPSPEKSFHLAKDKKDFEAILASKDVAEPQSLQLVEFLTDKLDTSWRLGGGLASRGKESAEYLTREVRSYFFVSLLCSFDAVANSVVVRASSMPTETGDLRMRVLLLPSNGLRGGELCEEALGGGATYSKAWKLG
jgi:hypothetical protein